MLICNGFTNKENLMEPTLVKEKQLQIGKLPCHILKEILEDLPGDPNLLKNPADGPPGRTRGANFLKFESPISAISLKK